MKLKFCTCLLIKILAVQGEHWVVFLKFSFQVPDYACPMVHSQGRGRCKKVSSLTSCSAQIWARQNCSLFSSLRSIYMSSFSFQTSAFQTISWHSVDQNKKEVWLEYFKIRKVYLFLTLTPSSEAFGIRPPLETGYQIRCTLGLIHYGNFYVPPKSVGLCVCVQRTAHIKLDAALGLSVSQLSDYVPRPVQHFNGTTHVFKGKQVES